MKCLIHKSTNHQRGFNREKSYATSSNHKWKNNLKSKKKKHQTQVVLQSGSTKTKEQLFPTLYKWFLASKTDRELSSLSNSSYDPRSETI